LTTLLTALSLVAGSLAITNNASAKPPIPLPGRGGPIPSGISATIGAFRPRVRRRSRGYTSENVRFCPQPPHASCPYSGAPDAARLITMRAPNWRSRRGPSRIVGGDRTRGKFVRIVRFVSATRKPNPANDLAARPPRTVARTAIRRSARRIVRANPLIKKAVTDADGADEENRPLSGPRSSACGCNLRTLWSLLNGGGSRCHRWPISLSLLGF
jgi:hypothetical protein